MSDKLKTTVIPTTKEEFLSIHGKIPRRFGSLGMTITYIYMNIKPLGDNVLVKQMKADEVTSFGLVLPDKDEKKAEAEVVAVGPGKMMKNGERAAMEVKAGDRVLLKNWGGEKVELNKEEYKIVSQEDILAILE